MIKIYHYDFCNKREKIVKVKFNEHLSVAMDLWPSGDVDQFLVDFGQRILLDKWINFYANRYDRTPIRSNFQTLGTNAPETVCYDESKLLNSHGDTVSTNFAIWSEAWSENNELYRASIIVFH
jgi:hypothetical protein